MNIVAGCREVTLRLIQPVTRWQRVLLCLDQCHSDWLRLGADPNAQGVIGTPGRPAPGLPGDNLDRAQRGLAADQVFRPTTLVDGRVDQL